MEIIQWTIWILLSIFVIFGLKDWVLMIMESWSGNGKVFTLLLSILIILALSPALIKDFAPDYYNTSKLVLMVYVIGLLIYRFAFQRRDSN